jgi:ketosteroid isomerase-like protein
MTPLATRSTRFAMRGLRPLPRVTLARFETWSRRTTYEPIETVVSGNWGFQRGIERIRAVPLDGGPVNDVTQRGLLIVHRGEDGRWRYARGMTNGFPPAAAAAERSPDA